MRSIRLRPEIAAGLLALYCATALNVPFWKEVLAATQFATLMDRVFVGVVFVLAVAILWCLFGALAWPRLFKPVAITLITIAALAAYHTSEFGTLYDQHMIASILQTDRGETRDLLTLRLFIIVGLTAGLPIIALLLTPIDYRTFLQELRAKAIGGTALAVTITGLIGAFSSYAIPLARENLKVRYTFAPLNVLGGAIALAKPSGVMTARAGHHDPIDARRSKAWSLRSARSITVLVVGETARSGNFSLNGYAKLTNPALAAVADVVSFRNVESCGTATALSLPCMFSDLGMAQFTPGKAAARDNLTDVLNRAGFAMLWRDNQSGCKGICARIPNEQTNLQPKEFYKDSDTLDAALLDRLDVWIDSVTGHGVVILHMMGSHGPAYFKRYDPLTAPFQPTCSTAQLSSCSREALVNTYDNSIHYTDHVLGRLVTLLAQADTRGIATAMLYISDHGESLGERGVYLHGLPKVLAPKEQTHIPWITWMSPRFRRDARLDVTCLARHDSRPLSHDSLYHSVLGLLDIESSSYRPDLDAYAICRQEQD